MKREVLDALLAARREARPVALVTELASGDQRLLDPDRPEALEPPLAAALARALRRDACELLELGERTLFVQPFAPPPRLVLVGAVHIAQPLAAAAALAGLGVVVVDPRSAWATPERFPGVRLLRDWPDAALAALALDARTAVVTLTHDPKLDDPALVAALRSPAFYVGALGSRRTHEARRRRLLARGLDEAELARISAPVGLDIGARSAPEIAIAILAEVIQHLRRGPPAPTEREPAADEPAPEPS